MAAQSRGSPLSVIFAIVLTIFLWSFFHWDPTPTTGASIAPALQPEPVASKLDSALEKEPLRVYVPTEHVNPDALSKIPGFSSQMSSSPGPDGPICPPVPPFDATLCPKEECPTVPLDASRCPPPEVQPSSVSDVSKPLDRPLVLYAYFETEFGRANLAFFVKHGLHGAADFVFILNGETDVDTTLIPSDKENIRVVKRENTCYDLGAHAEVLKLTKEGDKQPLKDKYKRFILMNASIRGPFVPHWSKECWSDSYLGRLNEKVKLVGSTMNCRGGPENHVQSMIWALDKVGLDIILEPEGIGECFDTLEAASNAEIRTTPLVQSSGYKVDVMLAVYQSEPDYEHITNCLGPDLLFHDNYYGFDVHPYETLFIKTQRSIDDNLLEKFSEWTAKSGYSSYDVCK